MSDIGSGWFSRRRSKSQSATKNTTPRLRRSGIMALEPRMMYDGAGHATAGAAFHHPDGTADHGATSATEKPLDQAPNVQTPPPSSSGQGVGNAADRDKTWHGDAVNAVPMPHVTTWVKDPTEIVFIDPQAPDYQMLAGGVKPGIEVVVLDPNSDGVQQIANFLQRHPDPNLTTIDIVAHGQDGMLFLGNAVLDNATVGQYAAQLKTIGAAMQPGGDLMLYGCDVAADPSGVVLLAQITDETGVNVAAATADVGSAAQGGTWSLTATSGPISAQAPFTAATLAAYPDLLNADLFVSTVGGNNSIYVDQNGTVGPAANPASGVEPFQIVLDTTDNLYFVLDNDGANTQILEGKISNALAGNGTLFTLYSDTATVPGGPGTAADEIAGLQIDTVNHLIYFVDNKNIEVGTNETSVFEKVSYSTTPLTTNINATPTVLGTVFDQNTTGGGQSGGVAGFAMDFTNPNSARAVFTVTFGGSVSFTHTTPGTMELFTATSLTPTATTATISSLNLNIPAVDGSFPSNSSGSLVIDDNGGNPVLYFTLTGGTGSSAEGLYSYNLTNNSPGNITPVFQEGSSGVALDSITIDTVTGKYYGTTGGNGDSGVYVGSLTSHSAPTLVTDFSSKLPLNGTPGPTDVVVDDVTLSDSASTVTYSAGAAPITIDHPGAGISISDMNELTSATVSITTHFQSGDVLSIPAGDLTAGKITGTNITESYNSSTGVLTLSGVDTTAHYQAALQEVAFSSTLAAPSVSARTITFAVSDGVVSGTATDTVDIHDAPVITAAGTATFDGGGSAVLLDSSLTVTDLSSATLASATVSIGAGFISGDQLNFTNQNGITGSYNASDGVLTLTGSATTANYGTALESITYSFSPTNGDPTGGGSHTTRTIDWVVNDGTVNSTVATSSVATVHVAPTVTPSGLTASFTGGGAAVPLDGGITVNDVDSSGDLTGATVSIGAGFLSGDTLNFTTQNGISGSYIAATGVLTLSGTTTLANYKAALESITYSFTAGGDPTNGGSDTARTISWTVTDGSGSNGTSAAKTSTLDTVHVAPTVTAGASANYDVGGSAAVLDSTLTVADVDSGGNLHGATVSIGTGFVAGDSLGFTAETGITASYSSGTGVLTLSGTATLATYQAELDSITFSTTATTAGTRTIDWVVSDGSTSNGTSSTQTSTVKVLAGPQFSGTGTTVNYQETGSAVPIDSGLGLADSAGANITSATVTIGGFVSGDVLGIPAADLTGNTFNGTSITESYNSSTGVLTLSGSDTAAHYQSVLDTITYSFTANPTTAGTTRTVSYAATDANSISSAVGVTNTVDLVHTAPTVTAGGTVTFDGGSATPVTLDSTLTVSDVDSGGNLAGASVSISGFISGDTLNFTGQNGIAGSYNAGTGVLTLSGTATVAQYQTALDSITYIFSPANDDPTAGGTHTIRTIDWTVTDGSTNNGTSNTGTSTLDTVHVAPSVTAGGTVTFDGGSATPVTLDSTLTVSDVDSGGNLAGATVSIGGFISGDTLNFTNQAGIAGSYNASTGVLTLTGAATAANYQAALDSITYSFSPTNGDPTGGGAHATRTIDWSVTDGSTSNGTSNTATSTLDTVHVAPTVTAGGTVTFTGGSSTPVTLDSTLTVSDVDSGGNLAGATVSIGGFLSGDTLNFINQAGIAGSYNASTGVLTLTGAATAANYQTALDSITYNFSPTNGDPTGGGGDTARTISWSVTDGSTNNGTSNTATSTLDTLHVAPTVTAGGTVTFTGGSATPVTLDSTLTVSDADSGGNLAGATVSIGGFISGDTLNFTSQNGISVLSNSGGILTLTGTATIAQYQTALESISYSFSPANGDPTGGGGDTARTISWSVTDGSASNGTSNTAASTLDTVHVAPSVTAGGTVTFTGGSATPVTLDSTLTVSDADSGGNLAGATVSISNGFLSGDTLNFTSQNGISVLSNSGGILTLTGTATIAQYQAALDSITYSFSPANGDPTGGGDTVRTISWSVTDGSTSHGTSNIATSTLDTVHVAPTVTAGATAAFETGSPTAVTLDSGLTVSDADSGGNLASATVSIGTGFDSGDTLSVGTAGGLTVHYDSASGILSLTGSASLATYQAALDSVSFTTTSTSLTPRTIDWAVNDGASTNASSAVATSTLDVINGPLVSAGASVTYTQGGGVVALDSALTITDPVTTTLASATVSIGAGFTSGDTLNFTNQNNITGTYDAVHGVLTLTGTDTVADYQTALESISYGFSPANADPTLGATDTSRTINWSVNDGTVNSVTVTSAVTTAQSTTTPTDLVVTPGGTTATFDQGGSAVLVDAGITVADNTTPADTVTSATVTISANFQSGDVLGINGASSGTINDGPSGTITYSFSGSKLTLSGPDTIADYQTALSEVTFSSTAAPLSIVPRSITFSATDGTVSGTAIETVDIHDQPVVTAGATATFTGGGTAVTLESGLTLSDPSSMTLASATVTIGTGVQSGDVLSFNNGTDTETFADGKTITAGFNSGVLTLNGIASVADYQAALEQVQFSFTANGDPTAGGGDTSRGITWQVNDGTLNSVDATSSLTTVHVAPVVTAGGTVTFDGGSTTPVTLDSGLTLSDVDSGGNLTSATVVIGGFVSGDTLSVGTAGGLTVAYDSTSGTLSLTGSASLTTYQTALDSITYSFTTDGDPTAGGTHTTRTIDWTVTDGSTSNGASNTATSMLDTVHVAPTVTPSGATATFDGGSSTPVTLDSGLTVSDADSGGNLTSATVTIGGFVNGDTLNVGTAGGLTVAYDSTSGTLSLTGSASLSTYQTALDSVAYSFTTGGDPTAGGTHTTRTIDWSVSDGSTSNGTSNTATSTLDTVHVAPSVTAGGTVTFTGGSATSVTLDSTLTVSDADSGGNLAGATVSIGGFISGDTLNFTNTAKISGSYNAATGLLTLSGTDTVGDYQAALDSISYSFTSGGDPTGGGADTARSISWTVTDGSTSNGTSNTATSTLDTVHVAPTVTAGGTVTFTGGSATPVTLDSSLTVSDVDSGGNLAGATVSIGTGFISGDTLNFTNTTKISGSYNAATGLLTLSGTDTVGDYQAALDSITYSFSPTNGDPTGGGADTARSISWSVTDGSTSNGTSNTATSTLNTVHVAPSVTAGGTVTFDGGGAPVTLDSSLTVSDADSGGNLTSATVTIGGFVSGDTLSVGTAGGLTVAYDSTSGTLSLTGSASLTTYQTALDSISYSFTNGGDPTAGGTHTTRTIDWSVTDGSTSNGSSNTATSTLDTVHVAPTVTPSGTTATFIGGGSAVALDGALTVSDVDSGGNLTSATVSIGGFVSGDTLSVGTAGGLTVAYDSASGTLSLTGTASLTTYQTALDSITYSFSPTFGDPASGGGDTARSISWTVTDGSTSNGTSNTAVSTLDVVHAPPTLTTGGTVTYIQAGTPATLDSTLSLSDPDSGGLLTGATVQITSGLLGGDTLSATTTGLPSITASYNSSTGELTLSGSDTLADYQAVLQSVTFSSTSGNPTSDGADPTRTVTWTINDGVSANPITQTSAIDVHALPAVVAGATATFQGGGSATTLDGALTVNDISSATLASATVSIGSGLQSGDVLSFNNGTNTETFAGDGKTITASFSGGVLSLSGPASVADYQTALEQVQFSFTANGDPTNGGGDTTRAISWTVNDSTASSAAAASTVDTVHVAPTVTPSGATATFEGGSSPVALDSGVAVNDIDSGGTLSGATVTISSGYLSGDTLSVANSVLSGTNITATFDAANHDLILSGPSTLANYQTVLEAVTYSFNPADGDPTGGGGDTARTISWVVSDGNSSQGSSVAATSTLDTVHAPPVVTAGAAAGFEIGGGAVPLDSTLTVSDADSLGNLTGATVSIGTGFISADDSLSFTNQHSITGSYNSATGVLTLTGTDTVADYQAALDSVTFTTTSITTGSRTIDWTASDGVSSSAQATSRVDVGSGPQITAGGTATFAGGGSPIPLDATLTVTDQANLELQSATVSIGTGFITGDTLNFTNQGGITGSYDAGTGVLTLTGAASAANYQAALDSVTYSFSPSLNDPTNGGGDTVRTINWAASDGVPNSIPASSTLDVVHVAPTLATGGTVTYVQAGSAAAVDATLSLSDPDSGGTLTGATVQITSGLLSGDTLSADTTGLPSITESYNSATGVLTLSGKDTLADYQAVLRSVTYLSTSANPTDNATDPARTVTWTINDGVSANSTTQTSVVDVHALPIVTPSGATTTFTQGGSAPPLDGGLTVLDNSSPTLSSATVSIGAGFLSGDTLGFANQNGITGSYDATTGVLSLKGTASVADYQAALESITFGSSNPNPSSDGTDISRTILWKVSDGAKDPTGIAASSTVVNSTVDVHPVPTVVASGEVSLNAGPGTSVLLDPGIGAYDGTNITGATISIGNGLVSGDILVANTAGTSIHASYDAVHGILTLSGNDTIQDYQQVLTTVTFSSNQPQSGVATIAWQITDQNGLSSAVATSTVEINGNEVAPPSQAQGSGAIPPAPGPGQFGDFSGLVTTADLQFGGAGGGFVPGNFIDAFSVFHPDVSVVHVDISVTQVDATLSNNGAISFNLPLIPLEAALDGDVVAVTATLADGKPLPAWLQFNGDTGQFAGLLPDDIATGSTGAGGNGGITGYGQDPNAPQMLGQPITIEVVARDSNGNLAITDFTIDLSTLKPHGNEKHGWNVPPDDGTVDPFAAHRQSRDHVIDLAGLAAPRDVAPLHAMDHVLWHDASAGGGAHGHHSHDPAPAGRAGLSDQIRSLGWHAATAERTALLASLRQGVAGWR
jgi:hypothetical protein